MNCPRCKHGAFAFETHFLCTSCGAAFVQEGASVQKHPVVETLDAPGRYSIRLRTGMDVRLLLGTVMLAAMNGLLVHEALTETKTSEIVAALLLLLLMGPLMVVTLHRVVRASYGRVLVEVNRDEILVTETFSLFRPSRRIPRAIVGGFWVFGSVEEGGAPMPSYSLMLDSEGFTKVSLIYDLPSLDPAIALAEDMAKQVGVPADTRGSDYL